MTSKTTKPKKARRSNGAAWNDETRRVSGSVAREIIASDVGVAGTRVSVHRLHGIPGLWFGSCYDLNIRDVALGDADTTLEGARGLMLTIVKARVDELHKALSEVA